MNPNIARIMGGSISGNIAPNFILFPAQRAAKNQASAADFAYFLGVSADGVNFHRGAGPGLVNMPVPTWSDGVTAMAKIGDLYVGFVNNYGTVTNLFCLTLDGYSVIDTGGLGNTDSNGGGSGTWLKIAHAGSVAVGIGASNTKIVKSVDGGYNWNQYSLPATKQWFDIVHDGTKFIATANATSSSCATSADAVTWVSKNMVSGKPTYGQGLATNGAGICVQFVAANTAPYTVAASVSTDHGDTWTAVALPGTTGAVNPRYQVAWDGTAFCAIGRPSSGSEIYVLTSPDGDPWTQRTAPAVGSLPWIYGTSGRFFCGSANGGQTFYSTDHGVTWTLITQVDTRIAESPAGVA